VTTNRSTGQLTRHATFDGPQVAASTSELFPVLRSILSPEALLQKVTEAYRIGAPLECRLLKRGLNDTYVITTPDGPYILRVYRARWRSEPEIMYELELLCHLAAQGVSVSVPIAAEDGRLALPVAAPEGTRHLVLFTYACGTRLSWTTEDDAFLAGSAVATIHAGSDGFRSSHRRTPLDLEYLTRAPIEALRPFLAHRPADWEYLEYFAALLRSRTTELIAQGLDWGVCHGDFGPKNIHISANRTLTVFDFDLCGPGWRAFDLGLMQWVAMDHKEDGMWKAFLKGYSATRALPAADIAAVPLFHAAGHLSSLGLFAENVGDWGSADMSDWLFDREIKFFREWAADHASEAGDQ
jgi:Ser/Thr protein kinase RdoA (MazF antagonist)